MVSTGTWSTTAFTAQITPGRPSRGQEKDGGLVAEGLLDTWRTRLVRLVDGLGQVDDPPARAFSAWVLRERLFADPPRLRGRETPELQQLPSDLHRETVDRYRVEIEDAFRPLFPNREAITPFSGYAKDPADWRMNPAIVLVWLESRARPDVRLTFWSEKKGAIFSRKVDEGVHGGWKVHEGVVHSGSGYSSTVWNYIDFAMTTGIVVRADRDHGGRWQSTGYRRALEQDDWDKLYDRSRIRVPGAPSPPVVQRATSQSAG